MNKELIQRMKTRVIKTSEDKLCPARNSYCSRDCVCWRLGANLETDITQIWVECTHKMIADIVYRETVKFAREEKENE